PRTIADLPLPRGGAEALLAEGSNGGVPLPRPRPRPATMAWAAEIGPYASETAALATLASITARKLADASDFQVNRNNSTGGSPVFSLHLAGLSQNDATRFCGAVSRSDAGCNVVPASR